MTLEQQKAIDLVLSPSTKLLKINAIAGSGKSYLLKKIEEGLGPNSGLYLVFGKALEKEAKKTYKGTNVKVSTTHALPYKYVITQGIVDNSIARAYFKYLVKQQGFSINVPHKWTQELLSNEGYDFIEDLVGADTAFDIIDAFDDWLEQSRELDTNFTTSNITEKLTPNEKQEIVDLLEGYCNSKYIKVKDYLTFMNKTELSSIVKKYLKLMALKQIKVPFFFNLKYYHILLQSKIAVEQPIDLLLADEIQDSSEVVLEILKLYPAKKKVMVGDTYQAIYGSFAYCTDGFKYYSDYGVSTNLTQSFRVPVEIAKRVESFGKQHMNPNFKFKGTDTPYPANPTTLYVSRTNAGLIGTMMELHEEGIQYTLTRSVKDIFGLIKVLVYLSPKNTVIFNPKYKFLEDDIRNYNSSPEAQTIYKSILSYVKHVHEDNVEIQVAIATIYEKTRDVIIRTMNTAMEMAKNGQKNCLVTLSSSHASKGGTWTEVYINNDFKSIKEILEIPLEERTKEQTESIYNYYVAATRCSHVLHNDKYL